MPFSRQCHLFTYSPKFKEVSWPWTKLIWGYSIMHVLILTTMNLRIKREASSFTHSKDKGPKFNWVTWPRQRLLRVICHPKANSRYDLSVCTKFEHSHFSHSRDMKEDPKLTNRGDLWWLVTQGHQQCHRSIQRIRLPRNYASILYHVQDIVSYLSDVANLSYHVYFVPPLEFHRNVWHHRKLVHSVLCVMRL